MSYDTAEEPVCLECLETHDQHFRNNYVWLTALGHGHVVRVWFQEPATTGEIKLYTTEWWKAHCRVVDHGENLYIAHVKAFVDPFTRFAKMIFQFEDGIQLEADESFYALEQKYFDANFGGEACH